MNLLETLGAQRKGKCLVEAQQKLQELVKECLATGKKGKLVITLFLKAAEDSTIVVSDDVTPTMPKADKSITVFYADEQGALHREDPRQPEFAEVARVVNGKDQ